MKSYNNNESHININSDDISQNNQQTSTANNGNLAVEIKSAFKSYGKQEVLKNLSLNVKSGNIYGLLGPSGCGKTTILRSIVGRIKLDSGFLHVLGKEPNSKNHGVPGPLVGYMPQEISLYNEFTINETITYFGLLNNMKMSLTRERITFLINFLDLPSKDRLIKNLSGGQKRRVSMSVALLHKPELLILDEPTVGIWEHLTNISKISNTTIIITTHYIEEAKKADCVGLMRNGKILAESPPDLLIEKHNETSLENVFLKLCLNDTSPDVDGLVEDNKGIRNPIFGENLDVAINHNDSTASQIVKHDNKKNILNKTIDNLSRTFKLPKTHNFLGCLLKDSILLRRNIGMLVFEFLIPVIQISLFCLCIGREPNDLKVGIVNNETIYNVSNNTGSLMFINNMNNKTFNKINLNWSDAYHKTKNGELWGFIDLSHQFTNATQYKFSPYDTGNDSNVNLYLDSSNQQITYIIEAKLSEAYQKFIIEFSPFFLIPVDPSKLETPIVVKPPIYGDINPQFINYMVPGIMITIIFTLQIGSTGLVFVIEKKDGLLDRSWVAGVNSIEIMAAHVTAKLVIMLIQIFILLIISIFVFEIKIKGGFGSIILASFLLLFQGYCGMSYGLAISSGANDETSVLQIAIGSIFPSLLISGIIWPVEGMPNWVRFVSNFSPLTHAANAMRSISSRGWGLSHFPVYFGFITVILWSFLFDVASLIIFNSTQ